MTTIEIIATVLGCIGLGDIIKTVIEKHFSKKADNISNNRDEFAVLRDRVIFAEREVSRLDRQQIANNKRISRLYTFLADLTLMTCSREKCAMRDIIAIDFNSIEDGIEEDYKHDIEEIHDDGK